MRYKKKSLYCQLKVIDSTGGSLCPLLSTTGTLFSPLFSFGVGREHEDTTRKMMVNNAREGDGGVAMINTGMFHYMVLLSTFFHLLGTFFHP